MAADVGVAVMAAQMAAVATVVAVTLVGEKAVVTKVAGGEE